MVFLFLVSYSFPIVSRAELYFEGYRIFRFWGYKLNDKESDSNNYLNNKLTMSTKAFKTLLGSDRYEPFTEFIKSIAPLITCKDDYSMQDPRIFHWGEWFNRKLGYSAVDPFCDVMEEWLPQCANFFGQHFKDLKAEDIKDLTIITYEEEKKIICAAAV